MAVVLESCLVYLSLLRQARKLRLLIFNFKRGWSKVQSHFSVQWLIGFNRPVERNCSVNCFSLSLEMKNRGKRLEIRFAKQITAIRVSHSKSDLYN